MGTKTESRLRNLLPDGRYAQIVLLRRATAVVLTLLAAMLAIQPRPGPEASEAPVLVAARDLPPGHVLAREDLAERSMPLELVPGGALNQLNAAEGRVLGSASRRGEPLTDVRLAGPAQTALTTGDAGHAAVPVRLEDPDIADLLYPGRRVDLVTTATRSGNSSVLAERAPVISVRPPGEQRDQGRLIVVGLPEQLAPAVATASITRSVTVTLR
ncbi:SAF domain-containing protein [Saccharopolyspora taberi]|uniref:SAF domain-containing protein n=1 Tax=Saccharopolyspora taberi TaxID=60895 RepID=A0ABN3V8T6_9PSEU